MEAEGTEIANFIIKPLFLIESKNNQRLFQITNNYGETKLIAETTKVLVTIDSFKASVEDVGNFIFSGSKTDFLRIKRKVYAEMKTAKELIVLGHNSDGFWAWANGIYIYDENRFLAADEYGIVTYKNQTYYLPALSSVNSINDASEEDQFEDEKSFIYKPSKVTFEDWAKQFDKVHGDNGKIGMMFYFATLFRDVSILTDTLLTHFEHYQTLQYQTLDDLQHHRHTQNRADFHLTHYHIHLHSHRCTNIAIQHTHIILISFVCDFF